MFQLWRGWPFLPIDVPKTEESGSVITTERRVTMLIDAPNNLQILDVGNRNVQRISTNHNAIQTPARKKCYNCG
jgi:hypothetical protein